jgi:hypothetical protein
MWLLSHNKLATVDNLNKKDMKKQELCVFCSEKECANDLSLNVSLQGSCGTM